MTSLPALASLLWIALVLFPPQAHAAVPTNSAVLKREWPITRHVYIFPERGEVQGGAVVLGRNKFCFLPPGNCLRDTSFLEKRVTLTARDFSYVFSFKVWETPLPEWTWKQKVLDQFPEAKITGEFARRVADRNGKAYEVQRMAGKRQTFASRIVFVPFEQGTLQFEMTTPPDKLMKAHRFFSAFLSDFQIVPATNTLPAKSAR